MNMQKANYEKLSHTELAAELKRLHDYISALEAKQQELTTEVSKLLNHDHLTKLSNRTSFERTLEQLTAECNKALAIIVCDIDGLKKVNDELGYQQGNTLLVAIADILRQAVKPEDFVARIGGDEFVIIISDCITTTAEDVARYITTGISHYNTLVDSPKLSITMGVALDMGTDRPASELFQEAEDNMSREKLHQNHSARSSLVQTLAKTIKLRDFFTEDNIGRMQDLVSVLGKVVGLPDNKISDLRLFAQLHDLGKVGVPDHILLKPSPLTSDEHNIIQTHSEQGYQISLASHDLAPIAEWMLKHHEWWNGQGYPLGLKGEEIPIECRILAIADAYDAMTSNRPYRKALTHNKAITQLKEFSGIQFDPLLVEIFINILA